MRFKAALVFVCFSISLFAQADGPSVVPSLGPPQFGWSKLYFYSGVNIEYVCMARSAKAEASLAVTQIVDAANTATVTTAAAHGLNVGNEVIIAGVTGDTDLNGRYVIQTAATTTTFTVTSASVTDATYNNAGITAATTAPRTTQAIWSVLKRFYDGSGNLIREQWAVRPASSATSTSVGTASAQNICDDRATLAYN